MRLPFGIGVSLGVGLVAAVLAFAFMSGGPKDRQPEIKPAPAPAVIPALADVQGETLPLRASAAGYKNPIGAATFTPDSELFVASAGGSTIHVWNVADGTLLHTLEGQHGPTLGLAATRDKRLVSTGGDGTIVLWDLVQGKKIADLPRPASHAFALALSHDGKYLAAGGGGKTGDLRLWDLDGRKEIASLPGHKKFLRSLVFSPDDRLLAAAEYDGDLIIWDVAGRKPLVTLSSKTKADTVAFSADGKHLAASASGEITLWSTDGWIDEASVKPRLGASFLRFSSAVNLLVSVAPNSGIHLWDPTQLEDKPPLTFATPKGGVGMGLSPDGKTLATAGDEAVVRFWSLPPHVEQRFAKYDAAKPREDLLPVRSGPARVAIVAADDAEVARNLRDLATVSIGAQPEVQLLDRADVERVLREQKLSLSGRVDANTAVKAGKILAVDLLGIIEASPQSKTNLGLVIFDAATGVRLTDAVFGRAELEPQARETAASFRVALAKWRAGVKNLKTVCFLPARNADLPRSLDPFCEAMAASLERHLLQQAALVTLERKRLEGVTAEKNLATEAATRELLPAVLLIEVEIGRALKGPGLRATVVIRTQDGKTLHTIAHEVPDPDGADLLAPLLERVPAALAATQGHATVNRSREARRFSQNAEMLWIHGHHRQGLQAAEAAYALKADDTARLRLAEYLSYYAMETLKPGLIVKSREHKPFESGPDAVRHGLGMARRAHQLVDSAKSRVAPDSGDARFGDTRFSAVESKASEHAELWFCRELRHLRLQPPDASTEQDVREFQAAFLRRLVERGRELAQRAGTNPQSLEHLTDALGISGDRIWTCAADTTTQMNAVQALVRIWLEQTRQLPADALPMRRGDVFADGIEMFAIRVLELLYYTKTNGVNYSVSERESSLPLLEAMQEHPHPVIRLYGSHYHTKQLLKLGRIDNGTAEDRRRQNIDEAKRWIDRMPFKPPDLHRTALYFFLNRALGDPPVKTLMKYTEEYLAAVEFTLERGDVVEPLWLGAINRASSSKEHHARVYHLIRRMIETEATPPHRFYFSYWRKTLTQDLEHAQAYLLKTSPQLAKEQAASPWNKVVVLADLKTVPHANVLMAPMQHEGHVFVFVGGVEPAGSKPFVQLLRVPLDGGSPRSLGKAFATLKDFDPKQPKYAFWGTPSFITQSVVHRDHIYVGTNGDGIYAFPLAGGDATRIGETEGLPSLEVISLSAVAGKVAAILQGGYIVVYEPDAKRSEVIVSSRRGGKLSPFDDSRSFHASNVIADPERMRVLFMAFQNNFQDPHSGLWEYNLSERAFKRLLPLYVFQASAVRDGGFYLQEQEWLGRFDLAQNKFTLIQGKAPAGIAPQSPTGPPANLAADFPRQLYHGGYIWTPFSFRRQPIQGGKVEYLRHVADAGHTSNVQFTRIEAVRPDQLLVSDSRAVYLVQLESPPGKK